MCRVKAGRQKGAFSGDVTDDKAEVSLLFELGSWSSITTKGGVGEDCVQDVVVESMLTWDTSIGFRRSLHDSCCASSRIIAILFELQYDPMLCRTSPCNPSMKSLLSTYSSKTRWQQSSLFHRASAYFFGIILHGCVERRISASLSAVTSYLT